MTAKIKVNSRCKIIASEFEPHGPNLGRPVRCLFLYSDIQPQLGRMWRVRSLDKKPLIGENAVTAMELDCPEKWLELLPTP